MNQAEIAAVWQNNIPLIDRLFYHYLRDVVSDYATKTIGVHCAIRQSTIAAAFEFIPDRGSKLPPIKLTNKQVEKMCERAVARGWISRRLDHLGNAIPMQFRLELVDTAFFRPNEEGERKGSGRGGNDRGEEFKNNHLNSDAYRNQASNEGGMKGSTKNTDDGGISSISSNNTLSNAREGVSAISVDDFQIDDLLLNQLKISAINFDNDFLQTVLVKFQSQEKFFNQLKPIQHWRKLFVGYCASWKANQRGHHANQDFSKHNSSQSNKQAVKAAIYASRQNRIIDVN
ncbi:hypothetical protein [Catenovulum sediminis]|uniref:DnaT DNA-binding domain-containing protein n=1 Tax=Catenovulum sediminis TaxID=1740262 RepID=A0ABV1RKA9_9ALTE